MKVMFSTLLILFLLFIITFTFDLLLGYPFQKALIKVVDPFKKMQAGEFTVLALFLLTFVFKQGFHLYKKKASKNKKNT